MIAVTYTTVTAVVRHVKSRAGAQRPRVGGVAAAALRYRLLEISRNRGARRLVAKATGYRQGRNRNVENRNSRGNDDRPSYGRQRSGPDRKRAQRRQPEHTDRRSGADGPTVVHARCDVHARLDRPTWRGLLPNRTVRGDLFGAVLRDPTLHDPALGWNVRRRIHGRQPKFVFDDVHTVNNLAVVRSDELRAASLGRAAREPPPNVAEGRRTFHSAGHTASPRQ